MTLSSPSFRVVTAAEPEPTIAPGDVLGRYQILVPLAKGGMGQVWVARQRGQRGFKKLVAIKTTLQKFAGEANFEKLFLDEARVASQIVHPNVCSVLDLGEERGILYLAMEWVGGCSLSQLLYGLADRRLDPRIAARVIASAAAGLHAAHEVTDEKGASLGVVHRDISPQNLLLTPDGHVKVADFGIVRAKDQLHAPTSTGEFKGKMGYMAPEQFTSKGYDRRADVFALGCTLYQACVGKRPYEGTEAFVLYAILEGKFTRPSEIIPGFPAALEAVILRAMAHIPEERYGTAEEVRRDLEAYLAASGGPCTEAEVMRVIETAHGDTLLKRGQAISAAIAELDARERTPSPTTAPELETSQPSVMPETSIAASASGVTRTAPAEAPRRRRGVYIAAVAVAILGGGLAAFRVGAPTRPSATRAPETTASPTVRSVASPASSPIVRVRIRATPATARFSIDGAEPLANPFDASTLQDHQPHALRTFAPGYEDDQRTVTFAEAVDLQITLTKARAAGGAAIVQAVTTTRTSSVKEPTPPPPVEPPHVVEPKTTMEKPAASSGSRPRKPIDYGDPLGE